MAFKPTGSVQHRHRRFGRLAPIALLALGLASCAAEPEDSFIGLIVLDAARPDRFSSYGYGAETTPEMDRLAAEGTVFLNHFAQHTHTRESLPTMLFSRYFIPPIFPSNPKVPLTSPEHLFRRSDAASASLPRLLSRSGYYTVLVSAHSWMRPGTPIAEEFDEVHDLSAVLDFPQGQGYPDAPLVVDYLLDWLTKEGERHRKLFVYLHLMDTHFPHLPGADTERFLVERGFAEEEVKAAWREYRGRQRSYFSGDRPMTEQDKAVVDALYDGSLRFADRELGRLFRYLEGDDGYGRTLWAITGDHGEQLGEVAGRFGHGGPWFDLEARVPLILAGDGVPAGRFEHLSEHVDLNPTLLSAAGLPLPDGVELDGVDLFAVARGEIPAKEYLFSSNAIRDVRYKAIFPQAGSLLRPVPVPSADEISGRLFDLAEDPLEERNAWSSEPAVADRLIEAFASRMRPHFRRYLATHTNEQPRSAFAIGAHRFHLADSANGALGSESEELTIHDATWPDYHLLLPPGGTAALGFRIPDGIYRVSVAFAGEGTIDGGGGSEVALSGPPVDQGTRIRDLDKGTADLGEVRVVDTRFHAQVRGDGSEGLLIRYFGFEPAGSSARERTQEDVEAEERLRSLGYIN